MSELTHKWEKQRRKKDRARDDATPQVHKDALVTLRQEAEDKGATLHSDGEGGLPAKLVLDVFRRDKYRCKRCDGQKDLTMHHKGGIPESKWLSKQGHKSTPENLVILCAKCHDEMHEQARKDGTDSSQVTPEGDEGTDRDHGKPPAKEKTG